MKKILQLTIAVFALTATSGAFAQQRYWDEIFTDVDVDTSIQYGTNISVLSGAPASQNLKMDVYSPSGDNVTSRPLIVYLHTGSFLPYPVNGTCSGSRKDSATVEMCTRFAKRGYVVAAISYRLGWNPVSGDQDVRTSTLINAVYRGLQDAHNAVRFFRYDADSLANSYGINPGKIIVGGQGSGGYLANAYSTLNDTTEIYLDKFTNATTGVPYINTAYSGDFEGFGSIPGSPLNLENLPGINSEVQFIFNMGGALGDSTWLEGNEPPMVAFHVPNDPFAPYGFGSVIVPTTGDFVVEVSGSYEAIRLANDSSNQDVFDNVLFNDPYTARAMAALNPSNAATNLNGLPVSQLEGLFPFVRPTAESAPWEWWDPNCPNNTNSLLTNPDMSKTKALAYIDSIQGYLAPRIVCALQLGGCQYIGVEENNAQESVLVYPNPATGIFTVSGFENGNNIRSIRMFDLAGRTIINEFNLNTSKLSIDGNAFAPGVYFMNIDLDKGSVSTKVVIE